MAVGSAVVARHRAQSAADLAALAAAANVPAGARAACLRAQAVASAMRVVLQDCDVDGLDVTVVISADTGLNLGGKARAAARAGPGYRS
ncbi:MAG: flp pilus-assembly TadE/G-like family protein [Mycobacterium sp.]|nr:flp pilus-assembly TadE/G-like family protein [Mycobacterium sp.]